VQLGCGAKLGAAQVRRIKAAISKAKGVAYNVYEYTTYSAGQFQGYDEVWCQIPRAVY